VADFVSGRFLEGEVDKVVLVFNEFKSVVEQHVTAEQQELLRRFDEVEDGKRKKGSKKTIFEKVKDIFS